MTTEWDAATYDRISDPQARWGAAVLDRLPLEGDERVLDAGCGSGRVTALVLDRVPRGSVVALDSSETMLEQARKNLGHDPRVEFVRADLGVRPLPGGRARSTRSSRTRPSTGSPTTTRCSRTSPP